MIERFDFLDQKIDRVQTELSEKFELLQAQIDALRKDLDYKIGLAMAMAKDLSRNGKELKASLQNIEHDLKILGRRPLEAQSDATRALAQNTQLFDQIEQLERRFRTLEQQFKALTHKK